MSKQRFDPKWPKPVAIAHDDILEDTVCLSDLSQADKAAAFRAMQESDPKTAEFITRMAKTFGASRLYVDKQTAQRLGVVDVGD